MQVDPVASGSACRRWCQTSCEAGALGLERGALHLEREHWTSGEDRWVDQCAAGHGWLGPVAIFLPPTLPFLAVDGDFLRAVPGESTGLVWNSGSTGATQLFRSLLGQPRCLLTKSPAPWQATA